MTIACPSLQKRSFPYRISIHGTRAPGRTARHSGWGTMFVLGSCDFNCHVGKTYEQSVCLPNIRIEEGILQLIDAQLVKHSMRSYRDTLAHLTRISRTCG